MRLGIAFTAARNLDEGGERVVLNVVAALPPALRYITGAAIGAGSNVYVVRGRAICRECHLERQGRYDQARRGTPAEHKQAVREQLSGVASA